MIKVWITISESDWKTTTTCQCTLDGGREDTWWHTAKCTSEEKQEWACTGHWAENTQIFIIRNKGQEENVTTGLRRGDTLPSRLIPMDIKALSTCWEGWDYGVTAVAPESQSFKPLQQSLLETFCFALLIVSREKSWFSLWFPVLRCIFFSHPAKGVPHSFPHIVSLWQNERFHCNGY